MRLSLKINGDLRVVAAMEGSGYLSAHLIMRDRPEENGQSNTVRIKGIQTLETETIHSAWPNFRLLAGDIVELAVLDDGSGDEPTKVTKSSDSPSNLFANAELAQEVLGLVSEFENRLIALIQKSDKSEPEHEHKKFAGAAGHVLAEMGDRLLYPIYRRHKELVPNELKGEPL